MAREERAHSGYSLPPIVAVASREIGISAGCLSDYINGIRSLRKHNEVALKIIENLGGLSYRRLSSWYTHVEEDAFGREQDRAVFQALTKVSFIERFVLISRFGLDGAGEHSLEDTAERFAEVTGRRLSRERIRQIEAKGIRRLRKPDCDNMLRPYVEEAHQDRRKKKYVHN